MSKYDVNFKRLALLLLPTFWRRPLLASLVFAVVSPLGFLHTRFMQFRETVDRRLSYSGQVCRLRAALNDLLDPVERRVTITDNEDDREPALLWTRSEERSEFLPMRSSGEAFMVNRRGFGGVNAIDFWVNVPATLTGADIDRLRAVVNTYKLASKRFSINYISE